MQRKRGAMREANPHITLRHTRLVPGTEILILAMAIASSSFGSAACALPTATLMPHSGIADSDTKRPEMPEVADTKKRFSATKTLASSYGNATKCQQNAIEMPVFSGRN